MEELISEAAAVVFKEVGAGLSESVYQRALAMELRSHGHLVTTEVIFPVNFKGSQVGFIRADIVIQDLDQTIILELKAKASLSGADRIQAKTYKRFGDCSEVYLINFGATDITVESTEDTE